MNESKISIVTPSFNQAKFLPWTMRSIILQRYSNLQYVVMDGGSSDGSPDIIDSYASQLHDWKSAADGGQAEAIHRGFKLTTGDICAWVNSDDLLAPNTLKFVNAYFQKNPEVDMIYSNRIYIDEENNVNSCWILPKHSNYLMSRWDLIPQETAFWRRSIMDHVGGVDPEFQFAMDYDFFVRLMQAGKCVHLPRFLGAFRSHPEAKTTLSLGTTGAMEISKIHSKYEIRFPRGSSVLGHTFSKSVQLASNLFLRRNKSMPGFLHGVGWNYNEHIWGGLLEPTSYV